MSLIPHLIVHERLQYWIPPPSGILIAHCIRIVSHDTHPGQLYGVGERTPTTQTADLLGNIAGDYSIHDSHPAIIQYILLHVNHPFSCDIS